MKPSQCLVTLGLLATLGLKATNARATDDSCPCGWEKLENRSSFQLKVNGGAFALHLTNGNLIPKGEPKLFAPAAGVMLGLKVYEAATQGTTRPNFLSLDLDAMMSWHGNKSPGESGLSTQSFLIQSAYHLPSNTADLWFGVAAGWLWLHSYDTVMESADITINGPQLSLRTGVDLHATQHLHFSFTLSAHGAHLTRSAVAAAGLAHEAGVALSTGAMLGIGLVL